MLPALPPAAGEVTTVSSQRVRDSSPASSSAAPRRWRSWPRVATCTSGGGYPRRILLRRSPLSPTSFPNGGDRATRSSALGIASFGPVGLDVDRLDYGHITTTPKQGWSTTDVRGAYSERFDVPIGFDLDVIGAALAERRWGAAQGCAVSVYMTIGTGIGGGVVVDGRPLHGLVHPEHGHFRVRRRADDDVRRQLSVSR